MTNVDFKLAIQYFVGLLAYLLTTVPWYPRRLQNLTRKNVSTINLTYA